MSKPSFYELLQPGMVKQLGCHTFERDEILRFARKFDPQSFHVDEEAASKSNFGKLCASGWHTASIWMRKNVDAGNDDLIKLTGYDGPAPVFGPSPGVRNVKWLRPVFVDDTITFTSTLTGKRASKNRAGWGLVTSHSEGKNQHGDLVISLDGSITLRID